MVVENYVLGSLKTAPQRPRIGGRLPRASGRGRSKEKIVRMKVTEDSAFHDARSVALKGFVCHFNS